MGGVVNIITKDANRPFTGNVSVRYGNNDESKYSLSLGTKQGRFSALTSLSYRKRDAYAVKDKEGQIEYSYYKDIYGRDSVVADTSEKGMSSVNGCEIWQANQKLSYTFNENFRISLNGTYYNNDVLEYVEQKEMERFSNYSLNPRVYYDINDKHLLVYT